MLTIRTVTSDSRLICADEIQRAIDELEQSSLFSNRMGFGSTSVPVDITITEGTGGLTLPDSDVLHLNDGSGNWAAFTHQFSDGHIGIYIPAELLKYGVYLDSGNQPHPLTIERIIAHEMTHAWQFANAGSISGFSMSNNNQVEGTHSLDSSGHYWDDFTYHPESATSTENDLMGSFGESDAQYGNYDFNRTDGKIYNYDDLGHLQTIDCIHEPLPNWPHNAMDLIQSGEATGSPLVMDVSSGATGLSLSSVTSDPVYWDIASETFRHASGWVSGDTGLLCIDLNSDGVIDDNSELFGNQPSSGTANGFQALASYDSNNDGAITSSDANFADDLPRLFQPVITEDFKIAANSFGVR